MNAIKTQGATNLHAHWTKSLHCSHCGWTPVFVVDEMNHEHYSDCCPYCGAKMDEKNTDSEVLSK